MSTVSAPYDRQRGHSKYPGMSRIAIREYAGCPSEDQIPGELVTGSETSLPFFFSRLLSTVSRAQGRRKLALKKSCNVLFLWLRQLLNASKSGSQSIHPNQKSSVSQRKLALTLLMISAPFPVDVSTGSRAMSVVAVVIAAGRTRFSPASTTASRMSYFVRGSRSRKTW